MNKRNMFLGTFSTFVVASLLSFATTNFAFADDANTATTNFETFTSTSVNGQDGWSVTDSSFDQAVVDIESTSTLAGRFGTKAFRISNAVTSGGFGNQTFSKSLENAVGEASSTTGVYTAGTLQNHFEMQFDIASASSTSAVQPGLNLSVSPDRGDGSRMSYIKFQDGATATDVIFYDVQEANASAPFVPTTVASIDLSTPHTIKLTLDAVPGAANDIVKVYVDGALVHVGTSWENYFRFNPEASAEQSPRIIKNFIIRSSGTAVSANAGAGYLFDNVSLTSSNVAFPALENVVTPSTNTFGQEVTVNGKTYYSGINTKTNIQSAIAVATSGDTIILAPGTHTLTSQVAVALENLTITGSGSTTIAGSMSVGPRFFDVAANGFTLQNVTLEKTDKAGEQNLIWVHGNNVTIKNNTIRGQFVIGDGDVSRALVVSGGLTGLTINGNTIYGLRQPAYVTGTTTGTVSNNFVYGTKGWVLEGGNLAFTGNTWGTGSQANVFDIAIIPAMPASFYTDIVAMANANNDAVIEDQRMSPAKLSVAFVDGVSYSGDLGGRYHPYADVDSASNRIVVGGKVIVITTSTIPVTPVVSSSTVTSTIPTNVESTVTSATGTITLDIASSTIITGSTDWDGTFNLPTVTTSATLPYELGGFLLSGVVAIEMGDASTTLTFSEAMKLTFAGQAGKSVGSSHNGVFTEITATCDSSTNPTLAAGADCKIDVGADLVVFTKHATTFIAYTKVAIAYGGGSSGSTGGSGGGAITSTGSTGGSVAVATTPTNTNTGTVLGANTANTTGQVLGVSAYAFARNLGYGATGDDVTELQKMLMAEGYLNIKVATKWFGPLTKSALAKWQKANGIPNTGYFGVISRGFVAK